MRHDVLQQLLENEKFRNGNMTNSGVQSCRFYRSSTRLPVSGRIVRVALWGGFRLGTGWCPRLQRFFIDG